MLKQQDPINVDLLTFQQVALAQPTACTTPATSTIPLNRCEGQEYGYDGQENIAGHGPSFWGCQHCVPKNWEAYSMFVKSRGVDLCNTCSRNHRTRQATPIFPASHPRQCTCLWDANIWLCRTCRMSISSIDRDIALNWIQSLPQFSAMHTPGQGTHPRDYINSESRNGQSYCPLGFNDQGKVQSYNAIIQQNPPNFRPLVRLCIYCRKQRLLTDCRFD
jgi:hypothetical protein